MMLFFVGAIFGVYLISRFVRLAFGKNKRTYKAALIADSVTLAIATIVGGYGIADGGPPVFQQAFSAYFLPVAIVLAFDLVNAYAISRKTRNEP